MKRIFITGGTGFFGKAVASCLQGVETVTLSRTRSGPGYLTGDMLSVEFPEEYFDAVIHMSLEGRGTDRLLRWAEAHKVERFLFTSSGAVYSQHTPYAKMKRAVESQCLGSSIPAVSIARCFAFTGPGIPLDSYAI